MTSANVALFFGGRSSEHSVSLASARSILTVIGQLPHRCWPIAIDRQGDWHLADPQRAFCLHDRELALAPEGLLAAVSLFRRHGQTSLFDLDRQQVLCPQLDLILPLIHGLDGEDGGLQGLAQLYQLPYCGSPLPAAALSMDKEFCKLVLGAHGLPVVPHLCLRRGQQLPSWQSCQQRLSGQVLFVKPCSQGSSIGISRVNNAREWQTALEYGWQYDDKLLVEPAFVGREIELAVLEQHRQPRVSSAGEIVIKDGAFYDYQHKYGDSDAVCLSLACSLPPGLETQLQLAAQKAFCVLGMRGLARIDFFLADDGRFALNEVNSIPGFTPTSMFPLLWQHQGLSTAATLAAIIEAALD